MSQFEYVAVAVSLVLSFGAVRILNGLSYVLNGEHRYWVHTLWVLVSLSNFAVSWWAFWAASDVPSWHLGSFLLALTYPGLLYVGAALLIPGDASKVTEWRSHFYEVRRPLFLTYLVATVLGGAVSATSGAAGSLSPTEMPGVYAYAAIYSAGLVSKDERIHRVLAVAATVAFLAMYGPSIYLGTG
jgi:hypothetical protein